MKKRSKSSSLRILFLDENQKDVKSFRETVAMSHVNARITHIAKADIALRRLGGDNSGFDLIVVGQKLAEMTGLKFCREVVEHKISLPLVFITDKSQETLVKELLKMGFVTEYLIKDPDGKYLEVLPMMLSEVARHYSDRVNQERNRKALEVLEKRYRTILVKNADGVIIVDDKGVVQLANAAAKSMLGRPDEDLIGKPFPYRSRPGTRTEIQITGKDGKTITAEMRVVAIEWNEGTASLASLRDITYRKQMEIALGKSNRKLTQTVEELQRANQKIVAQQMELVQEERLKLLLQIAGATAQELNEPLMILLTTIELLRMVKDKPEKLSSHLDRIEEAGKQISNMIKKIQTIQQEQPFQPFSTVQLNRTEKTRILSVEDSDIDFETLRSKLQDDRRLSLFRASMIMEATDMLAHEKFDLVLTEYMLPDGNAVELIDHISEKNMIIPVVVITGQGDEVIASQVIQAGAADYIPKNRVSKETLKGTIAASLEKGRVSREIKEANKKMAEMSSMDELTGLYNRRYFQSVISKEYSHAKVNQSELVLCIMDLDHFKSINDTYGHAAGDLVLSDVGRMLKEITRQTDVVCRYGGEEFVVLLPHTDAGNAKKMGERFRKRLAAHMFEYNSNKFKVTVSMGIVAYYHSNTSSPAELIELADRALYEAKNTGRNKIVEFTDFGLDEHKASA